jgi:hypothetical protein
MPKIKEVKINFRTFLFYLMITIIIALSIYLIYFTKTDGYKCLSNPLVYGVKTISSSNNNLITCTCSAVGSNQYLIVTKDNVSYSNYGSFNLERYK